MSLELEINAATRAFLPEGALEFATPVRRVELKSPSGESKVIIGQVVPTELHTYTGRSQNGQTYREYALLVYRYEFSDIDTNFIAWREDTPMTYEEACELCWEDEFQEEILAGREMRFWLPNCADSSYYILFRGMYRGTILSRSTKKRFGIDFYLPKNVEKTLFAMSSVELDQFVSDLYADTESGLRQAMDWMELDENKKQEIAFACANGNWNEMREILEKVFQVILDADEILPDGEYIWNFIYPHKPYSWEGVMIADSANVSFNWRTALLNYFQPKYIDDQGIRKNIPLYLDDYMSRSEQCFINLNKPTQHEVIEAVRYLSTWVNENLSAEVAERLLDF